MELVLLADDLTGATDSAVPFLSGGKRMTVGLFPDCRANMPFAQDILSLSLGTRGDDGETAYSTTLQATQWAAAFAPTALFKKIDSLLRGNVSAELVAVIDGSRPELCLIAPALPRLGRTTTEGVQYVDGVPVHLSEAGKDPLSPATESDLLTLLGTPSKYIAALLKRGDWLEQASPRQAAADAIATLVNQARSNGHTAVVVADAQSDRDLDNLVAAISGLNFARMLWVGTAGLAAALARKAMQRPEPGAATKPQPSHERLNISELGSLSPGLSVRKGRSEDGNLFRRSTSESENAVLIVSGSQTELAARQIRQYRERTAAAGLAEIGLDEALAREERMAALTAATAEQAGEFLGNGNGSFIVAMARSVDPLSGLARHAASNGRTVSENSASVTACLGRLAAETLRRHPRVAILAIIGGETAAGVCRALGISEFEPVEELEPGVVGCRISWQGRPMQMIMKSGSFGDDSTLTEAIARAKGESK